VRAFSPQPGATTALAGESIKIWQAMPEPADGNTVAPGSVIAADARGIVVACGEGVLRVIELQPAGGRRMNAAAALAGRRVAQGMRFSRPGG
jgi:methionyl-tRNA formyltransferase